MRVRDRLSSPFRETVTIYDRVRVVHRGFPHKFEISYLPKSIHERVATEQEVNLESAVYVIDHPIHVTLANQRIIGNGESTAIRVTGESE